jgi:nucleoside-diphosphate-sugar epimerase
MKLGHVAIVGGAGFIGSHVVDAVQDAGGTPVVLNQDLAAHLDCEVRVADAANLEELVGALDDCDSVIHLAARAGGIQMQHAAGIFRGNRALTDTVLEACAANGIDDVFLASSQVVYRSSSDALEEGSPIMSSVDSPTQYAWSKATDEVVGLWWGEESNRRVVVGRFGNIYGPGAPYGENRSTVIHALIRRFTEAEPGSTVEVWGDGSAVRSFLYVGDAAAGVVAVLRDGESGSVFNIDSGIPVSIMDLAREINDAVGTDLQLVFDADRPTGVPYRVGSTDRLTAIGYRPSTTLTDGLGATISDFRERKAASAL